MNELQDQKLSQLVSLGGWLRGTQILTAVVNRHFTKEGAELLHQPDLLKYFSARLAAMSQLSSSLAKRRRRDALLAHSKRLTQLLRLAGSTTG